MLDLLGDSLPVVRTNAKPEAAGGKPKPEQPLFLECIRAAGGVALPRRAAPV